MNDFFKTTAVIQNDISWKNRFQYCIVYDAFKNESKSFNLFKEKAWEYIQSDYSIREKKYVCELKSSKKVKTSLSFVMSTCPVLVHEIELKDKFDNIIKLIYIQATLVIPNECYFGKGHILSHTSKEAFICIV